VEASAASTLAESIDLLLARVALSRSDGAPPTSTASTCSPCTPRRGSILPGVRGRREDAQLPGFRALEHENEAEIREARRLLYVGMTRARDRLVLTRVERRDGRHAGGDLFLREAGLAEASAHGLVTLSEAKGA
jgi:hypothetical protein